MNGTLRFSPVLSLIVCALLVSAAGCAGRSPSPRLRAERPVPVRGTIRLAVLLRASPQNVFLDRVDQAIAMARHGDGRGNATARIPSQAKGTRVPDVGASRIRTHRIAAFQAQRLAVLQAGILTNLETRLQRADDLRLAQIRSRLNASVEQTYTSRVDAIDDEAEAGADLATQHDRDAAVNLLTKIGALTSDLDLPPTAPDGYWKARLDIRKSELNALDARRRAVIAEIRAGRNQRRQDLRVQLQAAADASYAEEVLTAKTRRENSVETAKQVLLGQTADILASAKSLDAEADAAALQAAQRAEGKMPADENQILLLPSAPASNREDLNALLLERTRLKERMMRQTMQTATEAARARNAVIVGDTHVSGVPDITADVLTWIRADRWG